MDQVPAILERDVDLALARALEASAAFRERWLGWLFEPVSSHALLQVAVSDTSLGRESDVVLIVRDGTGRRLAALVENKVTAGFQDGQPEAYRERAAIGIERGHWDRCTTVLFAPRDYLRPYANADRFARLLAFEEAIVWASGTADTDLSQFVDVLDRAIQRHAAGQLPPDEAAMAFWKRFHAHVECLDLPYRIQRLSVRQSKADPWPTIYLRDAVGLRDQLAVYSKPRKGEVVLWFNKLAVDTLRAQVAGVEPPGSRVVRDGGSASLRIGVPALNHLLPFDEQLGAVQQHLDAMTTLFVFYRDVMSRGFGWPPNAPD